MGLAGQTKTQVYLSEAFNVHFIEEEVLQHGSQLPPKLQLFTTYIKKMHVHVAVLVGGLRNPIEP